MKIRTFQYAKHQYKWIRKQFLPAVAEARAMGGDVAVYVVHGGTRDESAAKAVLYGKGNENDSKSGADWDVQISS